MKTFSIKIDPLTNEEFFEVYVKGQQITNDAFLNKGGNFSMEERLGLGLDGFLRSGITSMDEQLERVKKMYSQKSTDMEKYIFLQGLLNRNEVLFYTILCRNLKEMLPIVYTPTVGKACLNMSHITRRFRGIYISPENIANIDNIFNSVNLPEVYLIVVTDGERILGLGDLGSDGMGIPVGKVNLYVAAGGIHPATCLPISLDVGTNNERLLKDPLYLGYRHERLSGKEYDAFIENFVIGVKRNFPHALLQWEDFAKHNAFKLLDRYRERILSFNDDIQGTGATAISALMSAMKIKNCKFQDNKYVIVGMGQAGTGIAHNIRTMLKEEGLKNDEVRQRIFAVEYYGLVTDDNPELEYQMMPFAHSREDMADWVLDEPNKISLKDVIRNAKANVLIGVTAQTKMFDQEILEMMSENDERPVIMPLSNPTSKSECSAEDVFKYTKGKGLMASGSPFDNIVEDGKTFICSQSNNMFIFPGMGLGALVSRATKVTDEMFLAASKALSEMVTKSDLDRGMLLPDLNDIREVSNRVAKAVAIKARDLGLGRLLEDSEYDKIIRKSQWQPHYSPYRFSNKR